MEGIIYNKGHSLPEEIIIYTLEALGCKNIRNNDYHVDRINSKSFRGKIPDFLCQYEKYNTAVEIGHLWGDSNKIQELLKDFNYVIHLFPDKKYFLLHCVLYKRKMLVSGKVLDTLKKQSKFCENLIEELAENPDG